MPDAFFIPRQVRIRGGANLTSDINLSAGGVDLAVSNAATGTDLVSYGVHYTTQTTGTFLIDPPEIGRSVHIFAGAAATGTTYTFIPDTTDVVFYSSSGGQNARALALNGSAAVEIVGITTALWGVLVRSGNVVGTSST
mgnify:CR=1 FL=1